eukprot:GHRQ01016511.1.p1 GENE.GHRQ01016511.1~~GHRQ01016511.1.p1  ORF type:complete len:214 (+),score=102.45 GHRQ01016511.1:22-663(+)
MLMTMLQVRQAEAEDPEVLEQLLKLVPCPPVALVALLKEGLDVRGLDVEKRLAGLLPFLEAQLSAADGGSLVSKADTATALKALVGLLPDLVEDVPKAPLLAAEMIGNLIGGGLVPLSLGDLAKAVKEAGAEDAAGGEEGEEMDPALIDNEKAAPMLLVATNAIKAKSGEEAAKKAWQEAGVDLAVLLPSFMRGDAATELPKLFTKYDAQYLE